VELAGLVWDSPKRRKERIMETTESRMYAMGRTHILANGYGKPFIVAFNKDKNESILCCSLEKLQKEKPFGLTEEDVFYRAEPGQALPVEFIT
jgi:hypothetical protein